MQYWHQKSVQFYADQIASNVVKIIAIGMLLAVGSIPEDMHNKKSQYGIIRKLHKMWI